MAEPTSGGAGGLDVNYRHIYHAGNFADVFKHTLLLGVADYLLQKDKPCYFLDTHAGLGIYDLTSMEAHKTGEFEHGIGRLMDRRGLPPWVMRLTERVRSLNTSWGGSADILAAYPGSPWLLASLLRPNDRLALVELHPDDYDQLRRNFQRQSQVKCHRQDAYEALVSFLPPQEKRGLILIDPPFEAKDEFARLMRALKQAWKRFPHGVYAIWYPIKDPAITNGALAELEAIAPGRFLAAELHIRPAERPDMLNGCGMAFLNPPWTLVDNLLETLPFLAEALGENGRGAWRILPNQNVSKSAENLTYS